MGIFVKSTVYLCILAILLTHSYGSDNPDDAFKHSLQAFSQNIFHELVQSHRKVNIIYSPFCIQTCLTMARMAAEGETAQEMDDVLGLTSQQTLESVADDYFDILDRYENSSVLHLANKVYVSDAYEVNDQYNEVLSTKFLSPVESINFAKPEQAASTINEWIVSKTNNQIKKFISDEMIDDATRVILLSAIHFKGEWEKPFLPRKTLNRSFFIDDSETVNVPMMYAADYVPYGRFPELQASAIRLNYKDSDLSMLIFLPYSRTGLADMEEKLKHIELDTLTQQMRVTKVAITLPKFKSKFKVDLKPTLRKLGMNRIFRYGEFGKMLKSTGTLSLTDVLHIAFIEVSETGTEAAAVTGITAKSVSMPRRFLADHPFHYVIVNTDNTILFQGNVVKF